MIMRANSATVGLSVYGVAILLSSASIVFADSKILNDDLADEIPKIERGQIEGRTVSIPVQVYKNEFKSTLKLGECPLLKEENGNIKTCSTEFEGDEVFIAKGSMTVDSTKVRSSEEILLHVMGGVGTSVGILGLISVSPKVKVAVQTETTKKNLNMVSSYEIQKGFLSLHRPQPKGEVPVDGSLYLSEIELGGNEMIMITLEFENEYKKTEVELVINFKILFWSMSARMNFIRDTFDHKVKVRIQFTSSFRKNLEEFYSNLGQAVPSVEKIEKMYLQGPQTLSEISTEDDNSHSVYHFSSWRKSPYGDDLNLALVNTDNELLTDQNTEMQAVLHEISVLKKQAWSSEQRKEMLQLNQTLTDKTTRLKEGIIKYHTLQDDARQELRSIYGTDKAPLYYARQLQHIIFK